MVFTDVQAELHAAIYVLTMRELDIDKDEGNHKSECISIRT